MTKYYILLPLLLLTLFSCRKDDVVEDETVVLYNENEQSSQLSGQVVDESGKSLEGVLVQFDNVSISTDEYGYFSFEELAFSISGIALKATKEGYIPSIKKVYPKTEQKQFIRFALVKNDNEGLVFPANDGGKVQSTQGYSVTFTSNSIIYENGADYTGIVHVQSHFYAPNDENLDLTMPGDLSGINKSGKVVQLETFGMLYVSLTDDQGNALNLKDGHTAELRVPIVNTSFEYPEETILWSLDENNGTWVEEGIAIKEEDELVGQVSHFSYWNYDNAYEPVIIRGTILGEKNQTLGNQRFTFKIKDGGIVASGNTNSEGQFYGPVPKDQELIIEIHTYCPLDRSLELGSFSVDTDLGGVILSNSEESLSIKANVLNCTGDELSNGVAILKIDDKYEYTLPIREGKDFYYSTPICNEVSVSLKVIDLEALTESILIDTVSNESNEIDFGVVYSCIQVEEFIHINVDGQDHFFNDAEVSIKSNYIDIDVSNSVFNQFIRINTEDPTNPSVIAFEERGILRGTCSYGDQAFSCKQNITLQFDIFNTEVGKRIAGTITGILQDDQGDYNLNTSFNLKIDEQLDEIKGKIWYDENNNNIRDIGEPEAEGINVKTKLFNSLYYYETITDANGNYTVYGSTTRSNVILVTLPEDYTFASRDEGNDDSIDSDIDSGSGWKSFDVNTSSKENLDIGLQIDPSKFCGIQTVPDFCEKDNFYCVDVILLKTGVSIDNIIVIQNDVEILNSGPVNAPFELCDLEYGSKASIDVYLSNGLLYKGSRSVNHTSQIRVDIEETIITCEPLEYSITAVPKNFGSNEFSYNWSTNETTESITPIFGQSYSVTVTEKSFGCSHFANYEAAAGNLIVRGKVWADKNNDNVFNSNTTDLEIVNQPVKLFTSGGILVSETESKRNGYYKFFIDIPNGNYYLEVETPKSSWRPVIPFIGPNEALDSDADEMGRSPEFTIVDGECLTLEGINFGFKSK